MSTNKKTRSIADKKALVLIIAIFLGFSPLISFVKADVTSPWAYYNKNGEYIATRVGGKPYYQSGGFTFFDTGWIEYVTQDTAWNEYIVSTDVWLHGLYYKGRYPPVWDTVFHHHYLGEQNNVDSEVIHDDYIYKLYGGCEVKYKSIYWWIPPWSHTVVTNIVALMP